MNLGLAWTIRNYLLKKRLQNNLCDGSVAGANGNGPPMGFLKGPDLFKCDSSGHLTLTSHKNCLQQSINLARCPFLIRRLSQHLQQNDYSLVTLLLHLPRTVISDLWLQRFSYAEGGFLICFPQTQKPQSPSLQCC